MMIATCLSYLCRIPSIKRFLMRRLTSSFPQNPWTAVKGEVSNVRPDCEKTTSVIPFQLDVGFTEKLMAKCKFEGVTLHAAFQVATMAAMSDFLGSSPNTQWTAMTTIDMRRLFPDQLTAQHVVQCLGGVEVTHRLPLEWKENFWQCAREVGQTLRCNMHAAVLQNMKTSEIAVKCNISLEDFVKCSQNGSRNHCYMSINNMGNCNFLNRHDQNVVHLKARFGGSSEHEFGPTMASSVTTLQQRINWSLLYFKNVTTKEEAKNVAQGIREALHLASAHL
ncbi:hypothetical protein CAPTEDRAFT_199231 [Capitella teleta]|uniref:Uncharacterized protein n=1 Tax=Capitella teleta TaxID=283909 RepID=R7TY89_CAPTE|nr:hypothetical protein CAPTEDRAFT_199231 [Capitella teleta]|eukprot:ELT96386.1 hypothetical protein CAPTEDRAFT_199231 [Capitella teleta]